MVIEQAILHIMDIDNEAVICTDQVLDLSEKAVADYLYAIVEKALKQDAKTGDLDQTTELVHDFFQIENNFIEASKKYSQLWHDISRGIEMPTGDYLCVAFSHEGLHYVSLIHLFHSEQITHFLDYNDQGLVNKLIMNRTLLPKPSSNLKEAIIFNQKGQYRLIETKYKVEDKKQFYLGPRFLQIKTPKHTVSDSLKEVKAIVTDIAKDLQEDNYQVTAKLQEAVYETVETGNLDLQFIEEKLFSGQQEVKERFAKKVSEKEIVNQEIPDQEKFTKKYAKQKFKLDNGIELTIPMDVYQNPNIIEFINQPDGSVSVMIKNIDEIKNKF